MINLVIDILKANTTLTALVPSTRIYPLIQLQGGTIPAVVVQLTSTNPNDTQDRVSEYDDNAVQITSIADNPAEAWAISEAVRGAIDGYTGGSIAQIRFRSQATDIFEGTEVFSVTQGYSCHLKRDGATLPIAIAGLGLFNLDDIADVSTDGATDDQVLTYDAATDSWGPADASTVTALGDLTDVTLGTPANNQVLLYNEAGPYWQNAALALKQLSNVTSELDDAIDRQALVYDEATSQWIHDGVGQVVIPVRNPDRDNSIAVGTVLKATGSQGDRILVAPFEPTDDPKLLIGIASEVLGNTNETKDGHAQVYGELRDISTNTFQVGDILYASAGGALTTTAGDYPIAIVLRAQENTGRIFIRMWKQDSSRYNDQVEALRAEMESSFASADVELMFSAQADGYGVAYSPESDSVVNNTPAEDYQVERAIYYNNTGLASYVSDTGWSTLTQNTESYAAAKARVEDYIRGGTYGKLPCTFAIVRTEESVATGLLVDYPGAAAAYSLRLLDTDYAGSAIRVRRASDNAEQDIGFDGNGDLDTTSLATFCSGTDGFVKVWYDQVGANDGTQTTTADQPKIYDSSTGVVTLNSKPAIQGSGNGTMRLVATGLTTTQPDTTMFVCNVEQTADPTQIITQSISTNRQIRANYPNARWELNNGFFVAINTIVTDQQVNTLISSGAASSWTSNGTTTSNLNLGTNNYSGLQIGGTSAAGFVWQGKYQEVIIWDSDQSSNLTGIESNINTYYSIYTP